MVKSLNDADLYIPSNGICESVNEAKTYRYERPQGVFVFFFQPNSKARASGFGTTTNCSAGRLAGAYSFF